MEKMKKRSLLALTGESLNGVHSLTFVFILSPFCLILEERIAICCELKTDCWYPTVQIADGKSIEMGRIDSFFLFFNMIKPQMLKTREFYSLEEYFLD